MQYADCFESSMLPSIMESRMFQKEYIREMARQQARYDFSKNAGVYANEIASSMLQSSVGEQVSDEGKKEQVPVDPLDEKMLLRQIEAGKVFPEVLSASIVELFRQRRISPIRILCLMDELSHSDNARCNKMCVDVFDVSSTKYASNDMREYVIPAIVEDASNHLEYKHHLHNARMSYKVNKYDLSTLTCALRD